MTGGSQFCDVPASPALQDPSAYGKFKREVPYITTPRLPAQSTHCHSPHYMLWSGNCYEVESAPQYQVPPCDIMAGNLSLMGTPPHPPPPHDTRVSVTECRCIQQLLHLNICCLTVIWWWRTNLREWPRALTLIPKARTRENECNLYC